MNTLIRVTVAAVCLAAGGIAFAGMKAVKSHVNVTAEQMEMDGQSTIVLAFTGDPVSSMSFSVQLPKGVRGLSSELCVSELPGSHQGACKVRGNELVVLFYSDFNETLDPQTIGYLTFDSVRARPVARRAGEHDKPSERQMEMRMESSDKMTGGGLKVTKVDAARAISVE